MLIERLRQNGYALIKPEPPRPSFFRVVWQRVRQFMAFGNDLLSLSAASAAQADERARRP